MNTYSDFKVGQLVQHKKSGKVYQVQDDQVTCNGRLYVLGQRNGKDFGPIRFIAVDALRAVTQ